MDITVQLTLSMNSTVTTTLKPMELILISRMAPHWIHKWGIKSLCMKQACTSLNKPSRWLSLMPLCKPLMNTVAFSCHLGAHHLEGKGEPEEWIKSKTWWHMLGVPWVRMPPLTTSQSGWKCCYWRWWIWRTRFCNWEMIEI